MSAARLPVHPAQRIDRSRTVTFTLAGRSFSGFAGDTIGSALYAAGVRIFSRSFKYHRPRGLLCGRGHCPNCLVNVDGVPNVRACVTPVSEGQRVVPQHAWPSLQWDALAILDRIHFLFPVGFYYKTFIHPRRLWPTYERALRRFSGLGRISVAGEPPGEYERAHLFADVAVVGGGAAGMAAALEAARWGTSVVLVDDQPELGGRWRSETRGQFDGRAGWEVARELAAEITAAPAVRIITGATAFGLYEDGLLGVMEGNRLVRLRAREVVVATGGLEYPMVFENNDLPGVMLAGAVRRLQALHGVRPGDRAVVVCSDDRGADLALDLHAAGVRVLALADSRSEAEPPSALRATGAMVLAGHTVLAARGSGRVSRAVLGDLRGGRRRHLDCDLICLATGFEPAASLIGQAGGRLRVDGNGRLGLGELPPGVLVAGEVSGIGDLGGVVASGRLAGARAALVVSGPSAHLTARIEELEDGQRADGAPAVSRHVSPAPGTGAKRFVCLCEDVTDKDLARAVAEGFDHIETLKRYSTVTMGPCQGKMCHRLSIDLCANLTGRTIEETGATTARPPVEPVPLGALAARHADPVKLTAMHHLHVAAGARLMDMGPWKRPLTYGSVDDECRAVRAAVGLIDVSTLGKLEVVGRDAAAFLDWLHPNRFSDLPPGRARYRVMCDDAGIILDDGVIARLDDHRFLLTTGTGTVDLIEQWFEWWLAGDGRCAHVVNVTGALAAINVAGPRSRELLEGLTETDLSPAACPYLAARQARIAGVPSVILRIGFVGELGYEIHFPADYGEFMWRTLRDAGAPLGARAFGVEAQRVLRLEKQHLIVAQDTDALTNPFAVNLGGLVRLDKPDFIGRDALMTAREKGAAERLVAFAMDGTTTPPAEGAAVVDGGRPVGRVTSAKWSAWLGRVIGLAWVPAGQASEGRTFQVRVDGGTATARVVLRPLHDPEGARLRS